MMSILIMYVLLQRHLCKQVSLTNGCKSEVDEKNVCVMMVFNTTFKREVLVYSIIRGRTSPNAPTQMLEI
jgi:hypothetical protein